MHMRRRDVLTADAVICFIMFTAVPVLSTIYGSVWLVLVPIVIIGRLAAQKLILDKDADLEHRTLRRTFMNTDPVSFEMFFVSAAAAVSLSMWKISSAASASILIMALITRLFLEYFWFADRPDRWYLFRFFIYDLRRKMHPSYAERLQKILITEVDGMKGHDFERYVAELMKMNGFTKVKVTKGSGDYGIDITANLDRDKYAIQCKRSESKIGIKAVQEAFLGREHYKADVAVVVTNNYFTNQAYEAAEGKVALWDRERLGNLIKKARDSLSDERYNEEMAATETEIRMFAALFDNGRGDARLTEKVMGTLYPSGNIRSAEDIDHFLRRVSEHIYDSEGITERRVIRAKHAIERNRSITPFEADIVCYHLSESHTITMKDMSAVRSRLAKAFIGSRDG